MFPDKLTLEKEYKQSLPDVFSGLASGSSSPQQLSFYRKQLQVSPQPLSGSVIVRTVGYNPDQAFRFNQSLLVQSRRFVNEVNQSISADQNLFAQKEVENETNDGSEEEEEDYTELLENDYQLSRAIDAVKTIAVLN